MTTRRSAIERELKLSVWPGFEMPDIGRALKGGRLGEPVARRLDATYHDAADLRLLRQGITLRLRRGEGDAPVWTLKLPSGGEALGMSRREISMPGRGPAPVPHELADVARPWALGARLAPVARMVTERRSVPVLDADGVTMASIDDDDVVVLCGGRVVARFRELEVELVPEAPAKLLAALAKRLTAAGAQPAPQVPKLVHALGPDATDPPLLSSPAPGNRPTAETVLRHLLMSELRYQLVTALCGVALGEPGAETAAQASARRLAALLHAYAPVLVAGAAGPVCTELERLEALLAPVAACLRVATLLEDERLGARGRRAVTRAIATEQEHARARLLRGLRTRRHRELLAALASITAAPPLKPHDARLPAADVGRRCARRALRDVRKQLGAQPAPDAVVGARAAVERLASAAEGAGPAATEVSADLERLRDAVASAAERAANARVLRRIAPPGGAWAAGVLAGMQLQQAEDATAAAAELWRAASRKDRWSRLA